MEEIPGSEYTVAVDLVLIAAGFLGSQDYVTKAFGVEINERTNVKNRAGQICDECKKCVYSRGYAPGTVTCCVGDPRGPRSCKRN